MVNLACVVAGVVMIAFSVPLIRGMVPMNRTASTGGLVNALSFETWTEANRRMGVDLLVGGAAVAAWGTACLLLAGAHPTFPYTEAGIGVIVAALAVVTVRDFLFLGFRS